MSLPSKDQGIGAVILVGCLLGIVVYFWLVFFSPWSLLILQLTGFIAVGGILGIGAWIGWTMATTPPPKPIEEIEKEIEEEKSEEKTEEKTGEELEK
ncbi:transcriptional regulator [Candidatus Bathyarchaeota archaeon]|nr:MAG: transcriptional regulator [Candidatus Bathyarchaeota archaeon]